MRGARQVGKSTLIREFSKEFDFFIELNLERKEDLLVFDLDKVTEILDLLLIKNEVSLQKGQLLLFIDEIQESPKAISLLRFFYEDLPDLHVICAGSLLEHVIENIPSFPVGRIQQMVLHPFDFEEFMGAKGNSQLVEQLDEIPIKPFLHDTLLKHFHEYAMVGGMPEVVKTLVANKNYLELYEVYDEIWQTYKDDIEKYGRNSTEKKVLRHIVETAAYEKDRITLAGFGNSNYKSREVSEALLALDKARLIQTIYPTISTIPPQEIDSKRKPRLQFLDTGLLNYIMKIQAEFIGITSLNDFYRGKIIQHLVYQLIQSQNSSVGFKLHFWVREKVNSSSEVDLIYQYKQYLIPIEVKSGSQGRLRSLHQFMENTNHPYAIRLLANKLSVEQVSTPGGKEYMLLNLPYYLSTLIEQYIEWFVSGKGV
ncbi:MAG: AAA family ATPase [Bacteroidales bacterium]|nr:AAA family ATPase [Bacteroidales bacterium]MCF8456504.1 AAA family ATPase [Bacteroidales bacterium]